MLSLSKLVLTVGVAAFGAYVFYNEPNAAEDPPGAIWRASHKLATTCDRQPDFCDAAANVARGLGHAVRVGFAVASGEGRLVYVESGDTLHCAPNRSWNDRLNGDPLWQPQNYQTWQGGRQQRN